MTQEIVINLQNTSSWEKVGELLRKMELVVT